MTLHIPVSIPLTQRCVRYGRSVDMEEFLRELWRRLWTGVKKPVAWISLIITAIWAIFRDSLEHRFYSMFNDWQDRHAREFMEWIKSIAYSPFLLLVIVICWIVVRAFIETRTAKRKQETPDLITVERSKILAIIDDAVDESKRAGGQSWVLWTYAAQARDIVDFLERLWHHWNNAGEKLIHPLNGDLDKVDYLKANLASERRDFMVMYMSHLMRLTTDLPGFASDIVE